MNIIADENIPFLEPFFGAFGDIKKLPGREIDAEAVKNADILLVRSITNIDAALLDKSSVRFVGSATIGVDHVDCQYLKDRGIQFVNAPGCNADSVVQYVLSALLHLSRFYQLDTASKTVGIIGCGNIGSRLKHSLEALNISFKVYDPLLSQQQTGSQSSFEEVIGCDIVTLHVPISKTGSYPTHHMINQNVLERMSPDTVLINSSRGAVIDNQALLQSLIDCPRLVVLDVWENEPDIEWQLLDHLAIATPHIAGYSAEGKAKGTEMLYQAVAGWLDAEANIRLSDLLPAGRIKKVELAQQISQPIAALDAALDNCYRIESDDRRLRMAREQSDRNQQFDLLRKNYSGRRDFSALTVELSEQDCTQRLANSLEQLGFSVAKTDDR